MHRVAFPLKARLEMTTTGSIELTPDYEGDGGITRRLRDVSRGSTVDVSREIRQEAGLCRLKSPSTLSQMDKVC